MITVGLAQAKARPSELLDKVAASQEVVITRRGKTVRRGRSQEPLQFRELAEFRATTPRLRRPPPNCCATSGMRRLEIGGR